MRCTECWTKGKVAASLVEEGQDHDPALRFAFSGVEAYVALDVGVTTALWTSVDLFKSDTPIGVAHNGSSVGVFFAIDVIFSVSTATQVHGGFWVRLPEGASMDVGLLDGDIRGSVL